MIEETSPITWQELQYSVNQIFNEIGLDSEVGKVLETPRGKVEIDVYAIDINSVDKIKYIVECKNWEKSIPQSVVHSFTTVMQETGGNIGYIISQKGLQSGAKSYTHNTNIKGFTFSEFQKHYFNAWFTTYFAPKIGELADDLIQYTEPFNTRRSRFLETLSIEKQKQFKKTYNHYFELGVTLCFIGFPKIVKRVVNIDNTPDDLYEFKEKLLNTYPHFSLNSTGFRGLIAELNEVIVQATNEFDKIFGEKIFAQPIIKTC